MSKKQDEASSDILSVDELIKRQSDTQILDNHYKSQILELEKKCVAFGQTIDQLIKTIEIKEEEITHLKAMLSKSTPVIGEAIMVNPTDEELIADIQLRKLKDNAKTRELTLDEIKKFDLLVKNKRLAQGNATTIEAKKGLPKDAPKSQLLKLATKKINNIPEE